ncbi:hypothetical protein [Enterovibrio coralii]|uniref:Uncharacterized protein n=1 Tax=Enterovibrio coralii TaxID=294935 RepID=A0A135I469_9GAMM|nr:hypothetical protein [Enterovibrio coralii]KXF80246.1 hypothetical protein ATN88_10385 [Enterovibrio coralii]
MKKTLIALLTATVSASVFAHDKHQGHIVSPKNADVTPTFDIVHAKVVKNGSKLTFQTEVVDEIGEIKPAVVGELAGSSVYSYVWPTALNSADIGFGKDKGIVALAVTAHPDFDDTPRYDENQDGDYANDGNEWHSHWVVLVEDKQCPAGLKVRDIPEGTAPIVPVTWPDLPIYIDSPGYEPRFTKTELTVDVPTKDIAFKDDFNFDAVTAVLKVNASVHNPLLCVTGVDDIASGDLSLPGVVKG